MMSFCPPVQQSMSGGIGHRCCSPSPCCAAATAASCIFCLPCAAGAIEAAYVQAMAPSNPNRQIQELRTHMEITMSQLVKPVQTNSTDGNDLRLRLRGSAVSDITSATDSLEKDAKNIQELEAYTRPSIIPHLSEEAFETGIETTTGVFGAAVTFCAIATCFGAQGLAGYAIASSGGGD